MKTKTLLLAILLMIPLACVQKSETHRTTDDTSTVETSTTTTTTDTYVLDTSATADLKEGAKDVARDAAQATGTALEKAGQKIQEHAKPGDQK